MFNDSSPVVTSGANHFLEAQVENVLAFPQCTPRRQLHSNHPCGGTSNVYKLDEHIISNLPKRHIAPSTMLKKTSTRSGAEPAHGAEKLALRL